MNIFVILVQLVSASFGLIYILMLSKWKYPKKTIFTAVVVYILVTTLINFHIVKYLVPIKNEYPICDFLYRVGNMSCVLIFSSFLVRMRAAQRFFSAITAGICVFIVDTIALTIRVKLGIYPLELLYEFLVYPIMFLLILKIRKPFLEVMSYMQNRLWPLFGISSFLMICIFLQISIPLPLEHAPENIPAALMLCGISATVYAMVFFMFKTLHAQNELERNIRVMEINTASLEHQNNMAMQNAKKMALFRHDLRHTGQMILTCLNSGDIDGARNLIYDIDHDMRVSDSLNAIREVTGYKLIDAALGYYIDSAKEAGIDVSVNMHRLDGIDTDTTELAVVLSNALENAVNACVKLPDGSPRVIRVDGRKHGVQFFIEIANTCGDDIAFDPATGLPVSHEQEHGLGSQSIAYFAQKHGAALEYSVKDNFFYLRILL